MSQLDKKRAACILLAMKDPRMNQVSAALEYLYVVGPKSAAEGGGQGLCLYLVDPSVEGWDRQFDGTGQTHLPDLLIAHQ